MKKIVITGTSSGIGRATASLLSKEHKIILVSRDVEKLKKLFGENKNCEIYQCDLMNIEEIEEVAEKIINEHEIDVLINNAGVGFPSKLDKLTVEDYERIMDTNVKGLIFFTKSILKQMIKRNAGHIVNVSSGAGKLSNPVAPIYCTSKFALEGYTDGLRMQVKDKCIRISNVKPGGVDSNYWGSRVVDRSKFMTPDEMALVFKFVIDFPEKSNVVDISLESVR